MGNKRKKTLVIVLTIFAITLVIGATYAFVTRTLTGTKKVTLTAGTLSLVLDEKNEITISDALPMYDQVGMIQEDVFEFDLINNTSNPTDYTLKLQKVSTTNELSTSDVKYYLTKDGVGEPALLSTLTDGVVDTGTIEGNNTIEYTLRLWISDEVTEKEAIEGKSLSYKLAAEASMTDSSDDVPTTVTFAGITKEVSVASETMFNYSSEGCTMDMSTNEIICPVEATNGIYAMEDDDGLSYYYRGNVDNLVKFGKYKEDYYVYRYNDGVIVYEFASLKSCQDYNDNCSEENKTLKYGAGTPMYWRIIRINGDKSIRLIYAGTTPDAVTTETGIGSSNYYSKINDSKYTGYSFDRSIAEVNSIAKEAVDDWYNTSLAETSYSEQIVDGKFCSDSSGYEQVVFMGQSINAYGSFKRTYANRLGLENAHPTFKCPITYEDFGGSYTLKAGLITADEVAAAGGQFVSNTSYYLYNGAANNNDGSFWTLSPGFVMAVGEDNMSFTMNVNSDGTLASMFLAGDFESVADHSKGNIIRPVINLRADVVFKEGTDGSTLTPYELAE